MVWSNRDAGTAGGKRDWVPTAMKHSMMLQEIRGNKPLDSGLMGMDMCAGCCRMEANQRLTAEQVTNHPFIMSWRRWSADIEMISAIAPLLRHMPPGCQGPRKP